MSVKRTFTLIAMLICLVVNVSAVNIPPGGNDPKIIIYEGNLSVYGSGVDSTWSVLSFTAGLGHAKPVEYSPKRFNYDSLGIYYITSLIDTANHHTVDVLGIKFQPDPASAHLNFTKEIYYQGDIMIEGHAINKNTHPEQLKIWLPQYRFESKQHWYGGSYHGIDILFIYDATETLLLDAFISRAE